MPLLHLQVKLRELYEGVSQVLFWMLETTYVVARVAVAGDVGLAAADVDAGVDVGLAPSGLLGRGHAAGRHSAARNGGVEARVALGRREAGKGRRGNDERRVEHG